MNGDKQHIYRMFVIFRLWISRKSEMINKQNIISCSSNFDNQLREHDNLSTLHKHDYNISDIGILYRNLVAKILFFMYILLQTIAIWLAKKFCSLFCVCLSFAIKFISIATRNEELVLPLENPDGEAVLYAYTCLHTPCFMHVDCHWTVQTHVQYLPVTR